MLSTTAVEELSSHTPPGSVHWLQIYIAKDRDLTKSLIHRADIAGFKAIVVTADSPVNGMWGTNMIHNLTLPENLRFVITIYLCKNYLIQCNLIKCFINCKNYSLTGIVKLEKLDFQRSNSETGR